MLGRERLGQVHPHEGASPGVVTPDGGNDDPGRQVPYAPRTPADARRAGVAMIHQELSVCPDLERRGERDPREPSPPRIGFVKRRSGAASRRTRPSRSMGYPDLDVATPVRRLSPATRQIVEIARAVALESRVVILDETDLQPRTRRRRRRSSSRDGGDFGRDGKAVLFISHFLDEVATRLGRRHRPARRASRSASTPRARLGDDEIVRLMVGPPPSRICTPAPFAHPRRGRPPSSKD